MANINGTSGDDILVDTESFTNDHFNGKGGIDTLVADFNWNDDMLFNMASGEVTFNGVTYDTFKNIENLTLGGGANVTGDNKDNVFTFTDNGSTHGNIVYAAGGNDTVFGGIGEDFLNGEDGNDYLNGGDDDDVLFGGNGKDILKGGDGDDDLFGGAGKDVLKGGDGNDYLSGGDGKDILKGGEGNDYLFGGYNKDILKGGAGNDELLGGGAKDVLKGGSGNDYLSGGAGDDLVKGGIGNDAVHGGDGDDTLKGGKGNDVLFGGNGDDSLTGGQGEDVFFFFPDEGSDTIEDFEDGTDLINFHVFGFTDANDALSHFYEIGSADDNVVGFESDGMNITIKGVDLADIDASDLIL